MADISAQIEKVKGTYTFIQARKSKTMVLALLASSTLWAWSAQRFAEATTEGEQLIARDLAWYGFWVIVAFVVCQKGIYDPVHRYCQMRESTSGSEPPQ